MFQLLRNAVSGATNKDLRSNLVRDEYQKNKLKTKLAESIRNLQKNHIGGDHVVERNDEDALYVCNVLEGIFLHGYQYQGKGLPSVTSVRNMFADGVPTSDNQIMHMGFWDLLKEITHSDVITQLRNLVVTTEVGLCRAWVRLALNDCLMISYLDAIISDKNLNRFYSANAFLMDSELPGIMKELMQGLFEFEFHLNYNSSKLNVWDKQPLQLAGLLPEDKKEEAKKNQSQSIAATAKLRDAFLDQDNKLQFLNIENSKPAADLTSTPKDKHAAADRPSPILKREQENRLSTESRPSPRLKREQEAVTRRLEEVFKSDTASITSSDSSKESKSLGVAVEAAEKEATNDNNAPIMSSSLQENEHKAEETNVSESSLSSSSLGQSEGKTDEGQERESLEGNNAKQQEDTITEQENQGLGEILSAVEDKNQTEAVTPAKDSLPKSASPDTHEFPKFSGNRLGGDGWSGWSSAFETPPVDVNSKASSEKTPSSENVDVNILASSVTSAKNRAETFSSLLKIYTDGDGEQALVSNTSGASLTALLNDIDSSTNEDLKDIEQDDEDDDIEERQKEPQLEVNTEQQPLGPITEVITSPNKDEMEQLNFEVVPMSHSLQEQYVDQRTRSSLQQLTEIGLERGLDKQSFRCLQCGKPIGLIYGPYRCCYFDGGYYCLDCHEDEEHTIPARVIQNWDFRRHKVSKYNKLFLMKIEEEPLFHIDEINPTLYNAIVELNEVKMLRIQLQHIKEYVQTCRQDIAEDYRIRLWPREYLSDDIHQYSLLDLLQVHTGQLAHHVKKIISQFSRHIYKCTLCKEKGFICEYCKDPQIIYPFEINTSVQCPRCLSVYHKKCRLERRCPKCVRIHLRSRKKEENNEEILTVTQIDTDMDIDVGVL